jgi:hypothetical protein
VLENELDLRALPSKAKRLGFTDLLGKPYPDAVAVTLSADEYFRFMDGDDRFYPWDTVRRSLRSFYVFVLLKGPESFDSRNPKVLRAAIEARVAGGVLRGAPREEVGLEVGLRNAGNTVWLHEEQLVGGYVRLGGHLVNERREPVDWVLLPRVAAGPGRPRRDGDGAGARAAAGCPRPAPAAAGPRGRGHRLVRAVRFARH